MTVVQKTALGNAERVGVLSRTPTSQSSTEESKDDERKVNSVIKEKAKNSRIKAELKPGENDSIFDVVTKAYLRNYEKIK